MAPSVDLGETLRHESAMAGHGIRLGVTPTPGPVAAFAAPEHGVLVIGPPRSGKTTSVISPNVVSACGPVISTSTKPDVLFATTAERQRVGPVMMFDPSGHIDPPPGVVRVGWSPLHRSGDWDRALRMAEAMVLAARPASQRHGEAVHWSERAQALLGPVLHAGSLINMSMRELVEHVDGRAGETMLAILTAKKAHLAGHTLKGILATEEREQSGIWSTASSVLAAYRSEGALASAEAPALDFGNFVGQPSTLYICASSDDQRHCAPIVGGLLRDARLAAYAAGAAGRLGWSAGCPPLLLALDEVANIAPLHDLPTLVAEGGSQGVVTLACVQDLAQVEERWGRMGQGFLSLFNTKLVLPGIGDTRTLEALSKLGGEHPVPHVTHSEGRRAPGVLGVLGRRQPGGTTHSTRMERRLPVDVIAQGLPGHVVCFDGASPSFVVTHPWLPPSREVSHRAVGRGVEGVDGRRHLSGGMAGR